MKAKHLTLAIAALLAAGGLWVAQSTWRNHASNKASLEINAKTPQGRPQSGQMLRPPDPMRKFWELTPEQRVQKARQPGDIGG